MIRHVPLRLRMVWANLSLRTKGLVVVAIPLAVVLLTALTSYLVDQYTADVDAAVEHTLTVRAETGNVLALAVFANAGVRGYLATGREEWLEPYRRARTELPAAFTRIEALVADNPDQSARLRGIAAVADQQLAALTDLVPYAPAPGTGPAPPPADRLSESKALTARLVQDVTALRDAEDQLLAARRAQADRARVVDTTVVVASLVVGLGGGLCAMLLFTSGVVRRMQRLEDNARRLAQGQSLLVLPPGDDEVGRLGRCLEETSALLAAREQELRETQRFLEHLLASSPGLVVRVAASDSRVTYLSPNLERVLGYSAAEVVGVPRWWLEHVHPEDRDRALAELQRTRSQRLPQAEHEWRFRHRDGSYRWLYLTARPEYAAGGAYESNLVYLLDITARKQAEDAQQASEERLVRIIETMVDGVALYDRDGRITFANAAAERILGLDRSCIVDTRYDAPVLRRLTLDGRPFPLEDHPFARVQRTGQPLSDVEMLLERPNGVRTITSINAAPLHDAGGGFAGMVVSFTDVTERRQAAATLEAAMAQADTANRAKSEFLSRMSHELRTPLNGILGFAQLLQWEDLTPDQQENVEHILRAGRHLLDLINEVLDIARIESGRITLSPEPVQVREVVEETVGLIRPMADQHGIRLVADPLPPDAQYVRADRQRLKQVLLNLLANAVKYNRAGGSVTVTCQGAADQHERITITDTGPGIPASKRARLFRPFDRLDAEQTGVEGTGLGLALSKGLVDAMEGRIGVDSVEGHGTTVWVELPSAEGPFERHVRPNGHPVREAGRTNGAGHTVLYIEDNLANYQLMEWILARRPGTTLLPAMQGRLGLDLAQQHQPDLILLDLHLPDVPGESVLRSLQDTPSTRAIPVIVISADATPGQIERLTAAGARAYLTKPLEIPQFLEVLDMTLEEH